MTYDLDVHIISNSTKYIETNALITEDDNFKYEELEDGTIEITDYIGTDTEVVIPETIDEKTVTSIAGWTFGYCEEVTSITIPRTVTNIGTYNTFYHCSSLININVDSNNTRFMSENGILFNKEKNEILRYPSAKTQSEYIIPEGVTAIGIGAFESCENLIIVNVPSTVITIESYAFQECISLGSIEIPNSLTNMGISTFIDCRALRNIKIGHGIETIELWTFSGCDNLRDIEISEKISNIENYAFDSKIIKAINLETSETQEIELPSIIKRAINKNDALYSSNITFENCSLNIRI